LKSKKPRHPPDNIGNVGGRIRRLRDSAKANARLAAKDGEDYQKALTHYLRSIKKQLRELEDRLEQCPPVALKAEGKPKCNRRSEK
jgi:hypothetical protein